MRHFGYGGARAISNNRMYIYHIAQPHTEAPIFTPLDLANQRMAPDHQFNIASPRRRWFSERHKPAARKIEQAGLTLWPAPTQGRNHHRIAAFFNSGFTTRHAQI